MITKEEYKLIKELEERIKLMEEIIERNQINDHNNMFRIKTVIERLLFKEAN